MWGPSAAAALQEISFWEVRRADRGVRSACSHTFIDPSTATTPSNDGGVSGRSEKGVGGGVPVRIQMWVGGVGKGGRGEAQPIREGRSTEVQGYQRVKERGRDYTAPPPASSIARARAWKYPGTTTGKGEKKAAEVCTRRGKGDGEDVPVYAREGAMRRVGEQVE